MPKKPHPKTVPRPASPKRKPVSSGPSALLRVETIHRRLRAVSRDKSGLRRATIETLAEELEVSRNTVKYDLVLLEIFQAPVFYDPGRRTLRYSDPNYELRPPVWLKADQILALLAAIRLASHSRTFPMASSLVSALKELAPMIGGLASFGPETLDPIFSTGDTAATEAEARHFALLSDAIAQRRVVRLSYRKAKHDSVTETRLIHPLHWFLRQDACQLIVHEPAVRAERNFELVRIQDLALTDDTFAWPAGFDLKRYLAGAFGRFVGYAQHAVHVVFDRDFVPLVRERPWQTGQVLIDRPDGSAEATYHVCHTADLEQQILRTNGQAEVISPPEVRQRIRALGAKFFERHA